MFIEKVEICVTWTGLMFWGKVGVCVKKLLTFERFIYGRNDKQKKKKQKQAFSRLVTALFSHPFTYKVRHFQTCLCTNCIFSNPFYIQTALISNLCTYKLPCF